MKNYLGIAIVILAVVVFMALYSFQNNSFSNVRLDDAENVMENEEEVINDIEKPSGLDNIEKTITEKQFSEMEEMTDLTFKEGSYNFVYASGKPIMRIVVEDINKNFEGLFLYEVDDLLETRIDGELIPTLFGTGGNRYLSEHWWGLSDLVDGVHVVEFFIDKKNNFKETNENNNYLKKEITIASIADPVISDFDIEVTMGSIPNIEVSDSNVETDNEEGLLVIVTWKTNIETNGQAEYTEADKDNWIRVKDESFEKSKEHTVYITALEPLTEYIIRARSFNANGAEVTSEEETFTTPEI